MQTSSDRIDEASARCLEDYVHYLEENYNEKDLLRGFYTFGGWSLEERSIAEKQFQAAVGSLLTRPQHNCFSWALKVVTDRYAILNSADTEKYWGECAIVGEVVRRTEEGVAKTSQQLLNENLTTFAIEILLQNHHNNNVGARSISMNNVIDISDTLEDGQLHSAINDNNTISMIVESLSFDPKIHPIQCSDMNNIVKCDLMALENRCNVELHAYDNLVFNAGIIVKFSQCSYIVKIWGPLIEKTMAGTDILSQWGDTVPDNFNGKDNRQIKPRKMDLRLMCMATDIATVDLGVGEFAKSVRCTKYFTDKAKMIVCNKAQLNTFVKTLKPSQEDIKEFSLPMVQIMGLEAEISTLRLVSSEAYVIQKVANCTIDGDPSKLSSSMEPVVQLLHTIRMLATRVKYKLESLTSYENNKTNMQSFTATNTTRGTSATSCIRNIKETELSE
ncbi:hypothetical protein INT45_003732 [Circinella minor]|uniref:Uncharacterized protein n=1 Tax=Circinella minor TaxID=1195481 RepID=A0A8H7SAB0_9FUNG|nr:hypothetical protein INT45_003732 [Circinella minor]